jgi:hypothetical protein
MDAPIAHRPASRLPLADTVGIFLFATVGLLSHDHALSLDGYARDFVPVLGGWFAAALVLGAYREPSWRTLLLTWIVGVPLGLLVRALVLGRDFDGGQVVFFGITLAFTLIFVVALRTLVAHAIRY